MVAPFEFATAARILFGAGQSRELPGLIREFGTRVLLVTGASPARQTRWRQLLGGSGMEITMLGIAREPTVADAEAGAKLAIASGCQVVVAIGGGSVLDAGKAVAALAANPGDPLDYLEVVGKARPLEQRPLPIIAVPTTAGTGAEVTRNAVLHAPAAGVKVSLRHPLLLPRVAVVDPDLTQELPPELTASTGLDALTQLLEPFLSRRANPLTDALCRNALPKAASALPRAFRNGQDAGARTEMALASLHGGLALANAGLGVIHGFAAPIGGMCSIPHGVVCASLLPEGLAMNWQAARSRQSVETLRRLEECARLLTGCGTASIADGIQWVRELCAELKIPRLGALGIAPATFPVLAEKAEASSSMKGNPVVLEREELLEILTRSA